MKKLFYTFLCLGFLLPSRLANADTPVLVELFTSQSCSSCPQADALLSELAKDKDLITIGCHVTYWDHLRWKDTFSLEACTQRQRDYGQRLDRGRIYTPAAIINGRKAVVGSKEGDLRIAIRKEQITAKLRSLKIEKTGDDFTLYLAALPPGQQVAHVVTILAYGPDEEVKMNAGENRGETVTYSKPVTMIRELTPWLGKEEIRTIKFSDLPLTSKGFVAVVQRIHGGPVEAAGEYKID